MIKWLIVDTVKLKMNSTKEKKGQEGAHAIKRSGTAKQDTANLKFSELDDLFLNDKGKKLRNLKKKLDKYLELQVMVKQGDKVPDA